MNLTDSAEFDIRYTHVDDAAFLRKWLEVPEVLYWFPLSTSAEVENAIRAWIGFSRVSSSLTALFRDTPIAVGTLFLMPYRKTMHHCLFKILVDPEFQRRGVGRAMIRNLKHLAKNYFHLKLIHTEFFEGNPIQYLLEENQFREFARQNRYVKQGDLYLSRILMESEL